MSKKRAFVKYTKRGRIIPGSLIVTTQGGYPKDGIYREVPAFANDSVGDCGLISGTMEADFDVPSIGSFDVSISGISVFNQTFPFSTTGIPAVVPYSEIGKVALVTIITGASPTCNIVFDIYDITSSTVIFNNTAVPYNTTYVYSFVLEEGHSYAFAVGQPSVCP